MAKQVSDLKARELYLRTFIQRAIDVWPQFDDNEQEVSGADIGMWKQCCAKCGLWTFYDLKMSDVEAEDAAYWKAVTQ